MIYIDYENIDKYIKYSHLRVEPFKVDFHLHQGYEIYYLITGDVNYFVENKIYPLSYGDLMITNNHEIHKPAFQSDRLYERICLEFDPEIVQAFISNSFDLLDCFKNRKKGEMNKIPLNPNQLNHLLHLFKKVESIGINPCDGNEILKMVYLVELLVYINQLFTKIPLESTQISNIPERLVPILDYIDKNLDDDLSLSTFEKKFYINRYYLSKLFKKNVGSNIHNYIMYKRISLAKVLLSSGYNVLDTCMKSGFTDYSNFLKAFKKTVGVTPGKYKAKI